MIVPILIVIISISIIGFGMLATGGGLFLAYSVSSKSQNTKSTNKLVKPKTKQATKATLKPTPTTPSLITHSLSVPKPKAPKVTSDLASPRPWTKEVQTCKSTMDEFGNLCGPAREGTIYSCPDGNCDPNARPQDISTRCYKDCWQKKVGVECEEDYYYGNKGQTITYYCPTGNCEGEKPPDKYKRCAKRGPDIPSLTEWSACSQPCGEEFQTRSYFCPEGKDCGELPKDEKEATSLGLPPAKLSKSCNNPDCEWEPEEWGPCSSTDVCQSKDKNMAMHTRTVTCPREGFCFGEKPSTEEPCLKPCYEAGPWQPLSCPKTCTDSVVEQTRDVLCPSGDCAGSYPETKKKCRKYDCWKKPEKATGQMVDSETLKICANLEKPDEYGNPSVQSCWKNPLTKAEKMSIANNNIDDIKRGCPDQCMPFSNGANIKPTFSEKASCPTGNCLPDDPAKAELENPQSCPALPHSCWKAGAWQKEYPNEPACNREGRKGGTYTREVTCPSGADWKCKDKWLGRNLKPDIRTYKPYDRDCYEVLKQRDPITGKNDVEWDTCKSTKTKDPNSGGTFLTCGEAPFARERKVKYHGSYDKNDCGRKYKDKNSCRADGANCLWDSKSNVCNNRNINVTNYQGKTYYDKKPATHKHCIGEPCQWELGPQSVCKAATNQRTICGPSFATRKVTCSGGSKAQVECAKQAGCFGKKVPGQDALQALSKNECLGKGDQCRWDGSRCQSLKHNEELKLACDSKCPFTVVDTVLQKQRFVITPDTAQSVKDFAMRQTPENKKYFQTYSADGTFTLPGLEKLGDNMFTPSTHAKGTDMKRGVVCGIHAAALDVPRRGENPDLFDTCKILQTGEEVQITPFEQKQDAFSNSDKYNGYTDATGKYHVGPMVWRVKKDMPDDPGNSSEWKDTQVLSIKAFNSMPTKPADKQCANKQSPYQCNNDPNCKWVGDFYKPEERCMSNQTAKPWLDYYSAEFNNKQHPLTPVMWDDHATKSYASDKYVGPQMGNGPANEMCSVVHKPPNTKKCTDQSCLPPYWEISDLKQGIGTCMGGVCNAWSNRNDMLFRDTTLNGTEAQFKANSNPYDVAKCHPNTEHGYLIYNNKSGKYQRNNCLKTGKNVLNQFNYNPNTGQKQSQQWKMTFRQQYGTLPDGTTQVQAIPKVEKGTCEINDKFCIDS